MEFFAVVVEERKLETVKQNQKSRTNHVNMFRQEIGSNRHKKDLEEKVQLKMD